MRADVSVMRTTSAPAGVRAGFLGEHRDAALVRALASAIESRKSRHGRHAERVAERSMAVLRAMDDPTAEPDLYYGFLLHDVGQITIPDAVLLKSGPLEPEELALIKEHPIAGVELLRAHGLSAGALAVVRSHHERWDGAGYPKGLARNRIPLPARVFSVVDAYDSMTHSRPYRRAMDHDCAVAELRRQSGTQFDPACVDAFVGMSRTLGLI